MRAVLAAGALLAAASSALAVTVEPIPRNVTQPDGTTLQIVPRGDEFNLYWELSSGHTVVRDASGWWRLAMLDHDGRLVPRQEGSTGRTARALAREPRHLRPTLVGYGEGELAPVPEGTFIGQVRKLAPVGTITNPLLVILVEFNNRSPVGASAGDYQEAIFGAQGSIKRYFDDNTFGRLDLVPVAETHGSANDGLVGWIKLDMNHPNFGIVNSDSVSSSDERNAEHNMRLCVKRAIEAADAYVDFAAYDGDGNGELSAEELAVMVLTAGWEASYGGYNSTYSPATWGHHAWLGTSTGQGYVAAPVVDGVTVGDWRASSGYANFGEWMQTRSSNGHRSTIGVMVHELGHLILQLPDLYDTNEGNGESEGVGGWCLMGAGSWGRDSVYGQWEGSTPVALSGWAKMAIGAVQPSNLAGNGSLVAPPSATTPAMFRIGTGVGNEFFLAEYRSPVGWDLGLKRWDSDLRYGGGLIVYHVDERIPGNDNENRKRVDVEEANEGLVGHSQLDDTDAVLDRQMLFYAGHVDRFADDTSPDARSYDSATTGVVIDQVGTATWEGVAFSYVAPNPAGYAADSCGTALEVHLEAGDTYTFVEDLSQAVGGDTPPLCAPISGTGWYTLTAPRTSKLHVSSSGFDTMAAVLKGRCDALEVVACNDDVNSTGASRISDVPVRRGEKVYVVIGRYGTSTYSELSGGIVLAQAAPLTVTAALNGCPRSSIAVQVSGPEGALEGLGESDFHLYLDGAQVTPRSFAASDGGNYTFELWIDGGRVDLHTVRLEIDTASASGDVEVSFDESSTHCGGIAEADGTMIITNAAHLTGANGTNWRSDLVASVLGAAGDAVDLELAFLDSAGGSLHPQRRVFALPLGAESYPDLAAGLFDVTGGKGALLVRWASDPATTASQERGMADGVGEPRLFLSSRTYNLLGGDNPWALPEGSTYGQEVPAVPLADAIPAGGEAWMTGLVQRDGVARTNLGLVAAGEEGVSLTLEFFDPEGGNILTRSETLQAWEYLQIDKILQSASTPVDAASVRIATTAESAPLVAYISIVDDKIGDPVMVFPTREARSEWFVAMAAHLAGKADTNWRTDLGLANPGESSVSVTLAFLEENHDNSTPLASAPIVLPAHGCTRISDVVLTVFGRSGVKGALRIEADAPVLVASRTYNLLLAGNTWNLPEGATFGQNVPPANAATAVDPGNSGTIPGVVRNASYRSNLGLLNLTDFPATVEVTLLDSAGKQVGSVLTRGLRGFEYKQVNNVLKELGIAGDLENGTLLVKVLEDGSSVTAYLSVVDERTGDPVTRMALR